MRYIYMNNFRGFSKTIVPLKQMNFLVGENSTGKSSFLALLALVNQPGFWINPTFKMVDGADMPSYGDIVSAWAEQKKCFQVGALSTEETKNGQRKLSFNVHEFVDQDDSPRLARHLKLADGQVTSVVFDKAKTKYSISKVKDVFESDEAAISEFLRLISCSATEVVRYKNLPKDVAAQPPLPIALSIIQGLESGENDSKLEFKIEIPMGMHVIWIAPIRSRPKRIYDGINIGYSPEGEHAPLLLRKSLRSSVGAKKFAQRLSDFGEASGLFESVVAHSFGRGSKDPFEILVQFKGAELNINNVGYGVSQALPLVVEFLTSERRRVFAVQQPEVHLHPRAQAALGGLIYELASKQKHSFFIETHSDYLIDRYRLSMRTEKTPPDSQMLFFVRTGTGNKVHPLEISKSGLYPREQPREFRDFFVKEELKLLDL